MKATRWVMRLAVLAAVPALLLAAPAPASKPNVVFILADDLGWADTSAHRYKLSNLKDDLSEKNDLSAKEPQRVAEMDARIEQFLAETQAVLPIPNPTFDRSQYHPELEGTRPHGYKRNKH